MKKYWDKHAKMDDKLFVNRLLCKCGHSNVISIHENKKLCKWCGNYVFKNKQAEFEYRIKERMAKER